MTRAIMLWRRVAVPWVPLLLRCASAATTPPLQEERSLDAGNIADTGGQAGDHHHDHDAGVDVENTAEWRRIPWQIGEQDLAGLEQEDVRKASNSSTVMMVPTYEEYDEGQYASQMLSGMEEMSWCPPPPSSSFEGSEVVAKWPIQEEDVVTECSKTETPRPHRPEVAGGGDAEEE